jgi:hypothetical protein
MFQRAGSLLHLFSHGQPAQAIIDLKGLRFPDAIILFPNTLEQAMTSQVT